MFFDPTTHEKRIREIIGWHEDKPVQDIEIGGLALHIEHGIFNPIYGTFASRLREVALGYLVPGMRCLDLGTGSGYLACALAKAGGQVHACDLEYQSCDLAARNASHNKVRIEVFQSEGFNAIPQTARYDLILANLPFCRAPLMEVFSHSPYYRCFAAEQGLLSQIAVGALDRLVPGGRFLYCYATSGWLEELDELTGKSSTHSVHLEERSTCEIRWVLGVTKT